jgi:hypothetical protein
MTTEVQAPPAGLPAVVRLDADPVAWRQTPKSVKAKLRHLRRARDDAWLVWRAISNERQEAWDGKRTVEARLKVLTGARPDSPWYDFIQYASFHNLPDDHPEVEAQLKTLEEIKANIERLDPIVDARSHQFEQHGRLVSSVEGYLTEGLGGSGAAITLYKGPAPLRQKRETPVDAVERGRRRLRELNADRHRVTSAPWHAAEAKQRARAEIERLAARGQPSALPLIETRDGPISWAERPHTDVLVGGRLVGAIGDPSPLPLLFWLHRETLIQRIESQIDEISDDQNALTAEQRHAQISEIDRDRLAIQREEEFWVGSAIDDGMNGLRRPGADPRAVLGLADDMPAPVA